MKRHAVSFSFLVALCAITFSAANASMLHAETGPVRAVDRTQPPPPACPVTVMSFNTAGRPLTLDLTRSTIHTSVGTQTTMDRVVSAPGPLVTVPVSPTAMNIVTVNLPLAYCAVGRRYRFLLRNAFGVEKVLVYPAPTTFIGGTFLSLGDLNRIF